MNISNITFVIKFIIANQVNKGVRAPMVRDRTLAYISKSYICSPGHIILAIDNSLLKERYYIGNEPFNIAIAIYYFNLRLVMNAKEYRKKYAKEQCDEDRLRDLDFIGCYHKTNGEIKKKGFFHLYHGDKPAEIDFLRSQVEIAEDNQAVYEFLQNAVDASSTDFYMFWDDTYFLVINNGNKFKYNEIKSILNFSQSTKTSNSKNKIGKFGIGFKLIHRLVGQDNGLDEIINDYQGPILFSWDDNALEKAINHNAPTDNQWLFKILYTSFPCGVDEEVKDRNYQPRIPFKQSEYNRMVEFIKKQNIDFYKLKEGTAFFLKLGKDKHELLNKELDSIKNGIQYSLNVLQEFSSKPLEQIRVNDLRLEPKNLTPINIAKYQSILLFPTSLREAEAEYRENTNKEKISFYKFFPMGDQKNGLNFVVHCSDFSIESNRRKLHSTPHNQTLLSGISDELLNTELESLKIENPERYLIILANLYLSDLENARDSLVSDHFNKPIISYLKQNIPYVNEQHELTTTSDQTKVIMFHSKLYIRLTEHFHFYIRNNYKDICSLARKKLGIKKWDLADALLKDNIVTKLLGLSDKNFNIALGELKGKLKSLPNEQLLITRFEGNYNNIEIFRIITILSLCKSPDLNFSIDELSDGSFDFLPLTVPCYIKNKQLKTLLKERYSNKLRIHLIPDCFEKRLITEKVVKVKDKDILEQLLKDREHHEVIDFIKEFNLEVAFSDTLKVLSLDSRVKQYLPNSYEHKALGIISYALNSNKQLKDKIYIDERSLSSLSVSSKITFKYGKITNPLSHDHDKIPSNIECFIEHLESDYPELFSLREGCKSDVYEFIKRELKNKKINTYNRFKFILFYSLESKEDLFNNFGGVQHEFYKNDITTPSIKILFSLLRNVESEELKIINIKTIYPEDIRAYHVIDKDYAISIEILPDFILSSELYIDMCKKIGLNVNHQIVNLRKKLTNSEGLNNDDFQLIPQGALLNTVEFLSEKNFTCSRNDSINLRNLIFLFGRIDLQKKLSKLVFLPIFKSISEIYISGENNKPYRRSKGKYLYTTEKALQVENRNFHDHVEELITNNQIIYLDAFINESDQFTVGSDWELIEETKEQRTTKALSDIKLEASDMKMQISDTDNYSDRLAKIGRSGELYVKELLIGNTVMIVLMI